MKEWKVIVATLVIFTAGVVTGGLLVQQTTPKPGMNRRPPLPVHGQLPPLRESRERDPRVAAGEQRQAYVARLNTELSLRPDQTAGVEQILQDGQQRTRVIWESVQPRMQEELRHTRDEIRALLDDAQRERFDQINVLPPLAKEKKSPVTPKKQSGAAVEK
jgi:hypothetical protein